MNIKDFTQKCREQQGRYRERMGEPMGKGPGRDSKNKHTNMLVNGEVTGKNFVNEFAFNHAKYRVAHKLSNETINEYRLFNNMLSSQPMAFNLFCPFIQMLEQGRGDAVTTIFKNIFPDKHIGQITEVGLEYIHNNVEDYLGDKTAMDAIVKYNDTDGKPAFIAIETKYTDVLGENTSGRSKEELHYDKWIKEIAEFTPATEQALLDGTKPISQVYRNFLLTECYGIVDKYARYYSVILSPAQHPTTAHEVASLKSELKPAFQYKISAVSLEDFVSRTLEVCPAAFQAPFLYFKERYLF